VKPGRLRCAAIETANQKKIPVIAITYIPNAKVVTTVAANGG
jgi:hypothetical protein